MGTIEIAFLEIKRLFSAGPLRLATVVVCLVPLLYGGLWLWAFWNPHHRLDHLPVALVNEDKAATVGNTTLNAGGDLQKRLLQSHTFDWQVVSAEQAKQGLKDGSYYMALTVPRDFSARLAHADSDSAKAAVLTVSANESTNLLASQIGSRVFLELRAALNQSTTKAYLDRILIGISDERIGLVHAAQGAARLTAALRRATTGSRTLADGLGSAADGAGSLRGGLETLTNGAVKLETGAASAASGARRLARGAGAAEAGAAELASGSRALAGGTSSLASGLGTLATLGDQLSAGAMQLGTGAAQVSDGVAALASETGDAAASAGQLSIGAAQLQQLLDAYAAANPDAVTDATFKAALQAAAQVSGGLSQLSAGLTAAGPQAKQLAAGAAEVATGADKLAATIGDYVDGVKSAAGHAQTLDAGTAKLSRGAGTLTSSLAAVGSGANSLAAGVQSLSAGSATLADGASKASGGAAALTGGLDALAAGSEDLSAGLAKAHGGSALLMSRLSAGASSIPRLTKADRETRAAVMSGPVDLEFKRIHPVPNYGTGFAPYFIPLALWIGALMTYFLVRPLSGRALCSTLSDPFVALSGLWPAVGVAWLQASLLLGVVRFGLHLDPVLPVAFVAFMFVAAFSFTAILQLLSAAFGTAGKFLAIVLLMLQLTSAAGTFPIETAPRFFRVLNPFLPMTYVVRGLRQAISGGSLAEVAANALVLLGFAAVAIGLTVLAAHQRRTWTMSRLKPVLTL